MILSAQSIGEHIVINPFFHQQEKYQGLSYGLGPCGYDVRIKQDVILASGDFQLASTVEYMEIPDYIVGTVHDKSTWARMGIALQNTVLEPGWRGYTTLELTNHSPTAIKIYAGTPIAQVMFHMLDQPTDKPYSGKYQDQPDDTVPAILK